MEVNDFGVSGEMTGNSTPVRKPTNEIAKIMSNEYLKTYELNEYCNFAESDLKKRYKKVQKLICGKNESGKTITEYKNRNKTNAINSESLLHALNELYKYKCELKSNYIAIEKAVKTRKMKYKKVVSSYKSSWEKAVTDYNADAVFVELNKIQKENVLLEEELGKQKELNICTETEFVELKENIRKKLLKSIIEFSKAMMQYKQFVASGKQNEYNLRKEFKKPQNTKESVKLFGGSAPQSIRNTSAGLDVSDDMNQNSSIDVSVFDEIMVPTENLESQNLEEEGYSFVQNDGEQVTDTSKEEVLEYLNNYRQALHNKTTEKGGKVLQAADENESEYFRPQVSDKQNEQRSRSKEKNSTAEKLKYANNTPEVQQQENEEEPPKNMQMECEESLSEASYEKQMASHRENWPVQNTPSVSSEDMPSPAGNLNESVEPGNKDSDPMSNFKPTVDQEKNDFKSFAGFFMMGGDQETPKPSIFKLF